VDNPIVLAFGGQFLKIRITECSQGGLPQPLLDTCLALLRPNLTQAYLRPGDFHVPLDREEMKRLLQCTRNVAEKPPENCPVVNVQNQAISGLSGNLSQSEKSLKAVPIPEVMIPIVPHFIDNYDMGVEPG
jgi:hypothetical protein